MTAPFRPALELHAGAMRLALRPDLGGAIAGLWHADTPILRSMEASALTTPRQAGCFPLAPYSNRLGDRRFRWNDADYTTQPNFEGSPHSLHGVAWQRAWDLVTSTTTDASLRYIHTPDGHWPFAFQVVQSFRLTPQALHVQLMFSNRGDVAQPVGLGWHPYFPRRDGSRLQMQVAARWESDATLLPVRKVTQPAIDSEVARLDFDHCFEDWRGPARIRDKALSLQLSSSLPYAVVFTPPGKDFFCVEPVSHVNNAIHMADPAAHGLRTLQPDETFEATMSLAVAMP